MTTVYLETSFVSACVTTRKDAGSVYRREAGLTWWKTQRKHFDLCVSGFVIDELSDPAFSSRERALEFIRGTRLLPADELSQSLARLLVTEGVMPRSVTGDAAHVAIATVHSVEIMLSWNVKHLANRNKIRHLEQICRRLGYVPPQIVTPDSAWEVEI